MAESAAKSGGGIAAVGNGYQQPDVSATVELAHATLADNTATSGNGHQMLLFAGVSTGSGFTGTAEATVARSVFAHINTALGGYFYATSGGTFDSHGFNVSQRDLPGSIGSDRTNTDPCLGPLADNGGPTHTHKARPFGWQNLAAPNPFPDRCAAACTPWGTTAPCYLPRAEVLHIQVVSLITRAMEAARLWTGATQDNPALFANVPTSTGERLDLVTYYNYVHLP